MKFSLSEIYKQLILERVTVETLPSDIIMLSKDLNDSEAKLLLYNTTLKKPIGYIYIGYVKDADVFSVFGAFSEHGYGPFLYETAMTYAYPKGCTMSLDSSTSDDALNVWFKFNERNDVKKQRMNYSGLTHKKETYSNDNPYGKKILELEDTKFFYNYGKENLKKLIQEGKNYQKNNNISEEDIEYMSWSLES